MNVFRFKRGTLVFIIILCIPLFSWIAWVLKKPKVLNLLIVDKTVPVLRRNEHRSFNWILNHLKFCNSDKKLYSVNKDYLGFFPVLIPNQSDSGKYFIKDLDKFSGTQLDSIADALDMLYFTDTYGVYYNEWYRHKRLGEHSEQIYGGLKENDIILIEKLKERKKLILAEFNFFASPTSGLNRAKAEQLLNIQWKGWTFRFFDILDTTKNPELPKWIIRLYKEQHYNCWTFKKSGIVMHHEPDDIVDILDEETDLIKETPFIITDNYIRKQYDLPAEIYYPYWFDYTENTSTQNEVIAYYKIYTTHKGDSILKTYNLPDNFPSIIRHKKADDYTFYYFCGDFADNPIDNLSSHFRGIGLFDFTFYSDRANDRTQFFWTYYKPLVSTILRDYYKQLKR